MEAALLTRDESSTLARGRSFAELEGTLLGTGRDAVRDRLATRDTVAFGP